MGRLEAITRAYPVVLFVPVEVIGELTELTGSFNLGDTAASTLFSKYCGMDLQLISVNDRLLNFSNIYFRDEADAMAFKLTWI